MNMTAHSRAVERVIAGLNRMNIVIARAVIENP